MPSTCISTYSRDKEKNRLLILFNNFEEKENICNLQIFCSSKMRPHTILDDSLKYVYGLDTKNICNLQIVKAQLCVN